MSTASIYIGPWTDHSRGSPYGQTITITSQHGDVLISVLSLYVAFVGGAFWSLIAVAIHQCSVGRGTTDELHEQYQIAYRNIEPPSRLAWNLLAILWSHRRTPPANRPKHPVRRFLRRVFFPVLVGGGFTASSVLVSQVARPSYGTSDVLIRGGSCGLLEFSGNATSPKDGIFSAGELLRNRTLQARTYARACYSADAQLHDCSIYSSKNLRYSTSSSTCPFADEIDHSICGATNNRSLLIYTDLLDSNRDLGINIPERDSIAAQYNLTCAPINVTNHLQIKRIGGNVDYIFYLGAIPNGPPYTYLYNARNSDNIVGYQVR